MKAVRFWPQHCAERAAGVGVHAAHGLAAAGRVPPLKDRDLGSVDHAEGRDVDRLALAMLGNLARLGVVAAAAGVMCRDLDLAQPASFAGERRLRAAVDP